MRVETVSFTPHVKARIPERRTHADPDGYVRLVRAVRHYQAILDGEAAAGRIVAWVGADWTQHHPRPAWSRYRSPIANPGQAHPFVPSGGCGQYAASFNAIWGARAGWAERTAQGESGCRLDAYNPRTCGSGLHARGIMQQCGYSGPLAIDAELSSAWQLCLAQIGAWGYHGSCR